MSERSRLAQIIAEATRPDGQVDRVKVFQGLQLTPDAPEALLLDVFFATDDALRVWRSDAGRFETAIARTVSDTLAAAFVRQQPALDRLTTALKCTSDRVICIAMLAGMIVGAGVTLGCTWAWFHFSK